jgi:serine/threonine-protein kinase
MLLGMMAGLALTPQAATAQQRTTNALVGGMLPFPMGMVVVATLAQGEGASTGGTTSGQGSPTESQVPDVTAAQDVTAAGEMILSRGLTVAGTQTAISDKPIGAIVYSKPAAGSTVRVGSGVTIVLSAGLQVPPVTGKKVDDASAELTLIGFKPAVSQVAGVGEAGTVIGQSPSAGAYASKGDTVTLSVPQSTSPQSTSK